MKKIKALVASLANPKLTGKKAQIEILQQINEILLTEYVIIIGNTLIQPLLVEAYYYHKDKFKDENTHGFKDETCKKMQSNRFNQLYFHRMGYGGVDICLSTEDNYCLSFLIKNSIISGKGFCTQTQLYDFMKEQSKQMKVSLNELENKKAVLCKEYHGYEIVHTVRKGLVTGSYKDERLASLPIEKIKEYPFTLEKGHSKTAIIKEYLKNEASKAVQTKTIAELEKLRNNYMSRKEFDKLFGNYV